MKPDYVKLVNNFIFTKSPLAAVELINHYKRQDVKIEEVAYLAERLAFSGSTLNFVTNAADIASTGGPSSLSTLLGPLILTTLGFNVPSLGVPGRPAGGVDVLAQIPGYKIELDYEEIKRCLNKCGYVHFLANDTYTPADALLFKVRQDVGLQSVPNLVVASLLSKKIAVGIKRLGLDVRISPFGNFGRTWEDGKQNARLFCQVSDFLGIETTCFLTDGRFPYQPYIGRGEALLALSKLFINKADIRLVLHSQLCLQMATYLDERTEVFGNFRHDAVYEIFKNNLMCQGADVDLLNIKVQEVEEGHTHNSIESDQSGFLYIDIEKIRAVLVKLQNEDSKLIDSPKFPDSAGIILLKNSGDKVEKGEILATLRSKAEHREFLNEHLQPAFSFVQEPLNKIEMEIVENV